jgi:membrane-bound lytic murein transglycosylase B
MRKNWIHCFFYCFMLLFIAHTAFASENFTTYPEVQAFIKKMVKKHHFKPAELNRIFSQVKVRPKVIRTLKAPAEQLPWYRYKIIFLNETHIRGGVNFWNKHAATLAKAEKIYGVPASIIVATIGAETKYGSNKGDYPVIDALTNIAFSDSPRAAYFKSELEEFLLLTREQHLDPLTVKGSYAGAIGQPQFMPSSYRRYAIDFSGNGKIDLTNNEDDVIGSIANYYKKHGWKTNQEIAIPTVTQSSRYRFLFQKSPPPKVTIGDLAEYGIYPYASKLPNDQKIRVIALQAYSSNEYWVGLHNFDVIKRYNNSDLYAMAIYQMSYYISALREKLPHA